MEEEIKAVVNRNLIEKLNSISQDIRWFARKENWIRLKHF